MKQYVVDINRMINIDTLFNKNREKPEIVPHNQIHYNVTGFRLENLLPKFARNITRRFSQQTFI